MSQTIKTQQVATVDNTTYFATAYVNYSHNPFDKGYFVAFSVVEEREIQGVKMEFTAMHGAPFKKQKLNSTQRKTEAGQRNAVKAAEAVICAEWAEHVARVKAYADAKQPASIGQ